VSTGARVRGARRSHYRGVVGEPKRPIDDQDRRRLRRDRLLRERLRAEFIAGAEEDLRRRLGRGLTAAELERVLRHYPGDLP
jgi:hypothetical protein